MMKLFPTFTKRYSEERARTTSQSSKNSKIGVFLNRRREEVDSLDQVFDKYKDFKRHTDLKIRVECTYHTLGRKLPVLQKSSSNKEILTSLRIDLQCIFWI